MTNNQETVTVSIQGKEFEAQVWFTYESFEAGSFDHESFEEKFEFTELYLPEGEGGGDLCLMSLLGFEHVEQDIIKAAKSAESLTFNLTAL